MFRHRGKRRTLAHNLKLASLLSFVAGMVNISGLLFIGLLTTNVTGHIATMARDLVQGRLQAALFFSGYCLAFFAGSFCSGLMMEFMTRRSPRFVHALPAGLEVLILLCLGLLPLSPADFYIPACSLLFAMGLQNALVTTISNAVVRTTHLTGLFTDLGIELSQMFFYKKPEQQQKLRASIRLRLTIILFFILGCIIGGYIYFALGLQTLILAAALLGAGLVYDSLRYRVVAIRRRLRR